jgi:hypothetical protein
MNALAACAGALPPLLWGPAWGRVKESTEPVE